MALEQISLMQFKIFLLSAIKNKKIIRNGDGDELREYIHVKDASRLAEASNKSQYK